MWKFENIYPCDLAHCAIQLVQLLCGDCAVLYLSLTIERPSLIHISFFATLLLCVAQRAGSFATSAWRRIRVGLRVFRRSEVVLGSSAGGAHAELGQACHVGGSHPATHRRRGRNKHERRLFGHPQRSVDLIRLPRLLAVFNAFTYKRVLRNQSRLQLVVLVMVSRKRCLASCWDPRRFVRVSASSAGAATMKKMRFGQLHVGRQRHAWLVSSFSPLLPFECEWISNVDTTCGMFRWASAHVSRWRIHWRREWPFSGREPFAWKAASCFTYSRKELVYITLLGWRGMLMPCTLPRPPKRHSLRRLALAEPNTSFLSLCCQDPAPGEHEIRAWCVTLCISQHLLWLDFDAITTSFLLSILTRCSTWVLFYQRCFAYYIPFYLACTRRFQLYLKFEREHHLKREASAVHVKTETRFLKEIPGTLFEISFGRRFQSVKRWFSCQSDLS